MAPPPGSYSRPWELEPGKARMSADDREVILRTEGLGFAVDGKAIVENVSLAIARAEILCVLGPSGSGKSSFLRLLNRLSEPTSGTVFLEGQDYREIPPRELRRRMGMITQ